MFRKWKQDQSPADFRLMPVGVGQFSGLRRDTGGRGRAASHFKRVVVKFKTSKPFLERLFPSQRFKFRRADTLCTASLVITSLENVPWLGGESYVTLALQVHGVQYSKQDGGLVNGSLMPIHLVSRSEAVTSSREEMGLPSVPCDLDMYQLDDSCQITASWGGAKFADISLGSLRAGDAATERGPIGTVADYGVMVYRYIPAVGRPGVADCEYACVIPHAGESKAEAIESVASSMNAKLAFKALDWAQLPTLNHIASALSEMPVFDLVSAKVVEGTNVSEYLSCRRID